MSRFSFFLILVLFSFSTTLYGKTPASPGEIDALTATDWPEIKKKFQHLLDNPFPLILDWRDRNWHWDRVVDRLGNIDWPDEIREEVAAELLSFAMEMLQRPGYPISSHRVSSDVVEKSFSLLDVLRRMIHAHGKIAKTLHRDALSRLWSRITLTYQEMPFNGRTLKNAVFQALAELENAEVELEIVDVLRTFRVPESEMGQTVADYAFCKFDKTPPPPGKWTLEILPPATQTEFADAGKTIPQFVLGDPVTVRCVLKNENAVPLSLTYYEGYGRLPLHGSIYLFKESEPGEEYDYGRHAWVPWESKCILNLLPGEEKTFEYIVSIDWITPVRGTWDKSGSFPTGIMYDREIPWFCIGEPTRYELKFRRTIPEGAAKLMQAVGYTDHFYEGTIEGRLVFDLIPPPENRKQEILAKATAELDRARDNLPGFLQAYFVAPGELETILMNHRQSTDYDRLRQVYTGLEMFDTPTAVAEVERIKNWKPGPFQRLSVKIVGERRWPEGPIRYYLDHVYAARIVGTAIGVILFVFCAIVFAIRRRKKRKTAATPDNV